MPPSGSSSGSCRPRGPARGAPPCGMRSQILGSAGFPPPCRRTTSWTPRWPPTWPGCTRARRPRLSGTGGAAILCSPRSGPRRLRERESSTQPGARHVVPDPATSEARFRRLAAFQERHMLLQLGHSPDPDDAFMFYALAAGKIDREGLEFEHVIQDIETLNRRAEAGELEITAVSLHACAYR